MARIALDNPETPPTVPAMALPRAWLRLLSYRALPLSILARLVYLEQFLLAWRSPRRIRKASEHLQLLMPTASEHELRTCTMRTLALRRLGGHTFAPLLWRSRGWLLRTFQPQGLENLEQLKRSGEGVIILGTHAGYHVWNGPLLISLGYPMRLIQRQDISPAKLLLLRLTGYAKSTLPSPEPGQEGLHLKRLHDLLRAGEWLQHAADTPDPAGVQGTLFGHAVSWCRAPWVLARLSGVSAVPVVIRADQRFQPRMIIGNPIRVPADKPAREAIAEAFRQYLDFLENVLCDQPWNMTPRKWHQEEG